MLNADNNMLCKEWQELGTSIHISGRGVTNCIAFAEGKHFKDSEAHKGAIHILQKHQKNFYRRGQMLPPWGSDYGCAFLH